MEYRPVKAGYTWLLVALGVLLASDVLYLTSNAAGHVNAATDSLVLIAGIYMIAMHRWVMIAAIALVAPTIVCLWLIAAFDIRPLWLIVVIHVNMLGLLTFFVGYVLAGVLKATRVTGDTIRGAICAYLLIAVVFSGLYSLIEVLTPTDAFSVHESMAEPSVSMTWIDPGEGHTGAERNELTYFSITTLTTLGYGDIVPINGAARTLTNVEAVLGQLYLAILIARLVGAQLASARETEGSG